MKKFLNAILTTEVKSLLRMLALALIGAIVEYATGLVDAALAAPGV